MKKDLFYTPLLPYTAEEEEALVVKLEGMGLAGLTQYVESARLALGNKGLDPSWRPRVELGLLRAEAALSRETIRAAEAVEAPVVEKPAAAAKSKAKAKAKVVESESE